MWRGDDEISLTRPCDTRDDLSGIARLEQHLRIYPGGAELPYTSAQVSRHGYLARHVGGMWRDIEQH